jgi:hypothetical protein
MTQSKTLIAAAALAAAATLGGGAKAAPVAPVKVQAQAVTALSPLTQVHHRRHMMMGMYNYGGYGMGYRHQRYARMYRHRPYFMYSPFSYGFGYGNDYGYDPSGYGYGGYDYGGYGYGGYGNCYHPRASFYWGY